MISNLKYSNKLLILLAMFLVKRGPATAADLQLCRAGLAAIENNLRLPGNRLERMAYLALLRLIRREYERMAFLDSCLYAAEMMKQQ